MNTLDVPMGRNDAHARTVREYLKALLQKLWEEQEGFSGKRPFGNSGWDADLEIALVKAGKVDGVIDGDGFLTAVDSEKVNELIGEAIEAL